jgi:hypothetical protein
MNLGSAVFFGFDIGKLDLGATLRHLGYAREEQREQRAEACLLQCRNRHENDLSLVPNYFKFMKRFHFHFRGGPED